ncbi:MAG: alpha/beta hydrolase [Lewinellaceae bacterium]|nr:alpha/beta hydrolase [Lewinellaceae bacterium]
MEFLNWHNAQGLNIHGVDWTIDTPIAVLAMVHGQGEHIGRYHNLAEWFTRHQVAVMGFDMQGYGRSEGRRGHAKNLEVLLDDIDQFLLEVRKRYPTTPIILYGHSMGGNLTLNYTLRRKPQILSAQIASAPWIRLAFEAPAIKVVAARFLRRFMPTLTLPNGLAVHLLSHDPEVVEMYKFDPFVHDKLSAAAGLACIEGADWLNKYEGDFPLPLLLMHGNEDRITSFEATKEFSNRLKGNIQYKEWPGLYHEIHNEPEKEDIFNHTLAWIQSLNLG